MAFDVGMLLLFAVLLDLLGVVVLHKSRAWCVSAVISLLKGNIKHNRTARPGFINACTDTPDPKLRAFNNSENKLAHAHGM